MWITDLLLFVQILRRRVLLCCWCWNGEESWLLQAEFRLRSWAEPFAACTQEAKVQIWQTPFFFLIYLFFIQLNAFVLVYWESYGDLTTGNKCFNNPPHSKTLTKAVKLTIKLFLNKRNSSNHSQLFIFLIQLCLIKPALLLGFTIYCLMSSEYLTEKLPHKYYITVLWSSVTFTVDTMSLFNIAVPWC